MPDSEYIHERSRPLRDETLANIGAAFSGQIAMVQFPLHAEDETTPLGPVPLLAGRVINGRDIQAARIFITHHGKGDKETNSVQYRVYTRFAADADANDAIFGNGVYEISNEAGHFTNINGYDRPLLDHGYRRLGLILRKTVFTEAETWQAVCDLRQDGILCPVEQVITDRTEYLPRAWRWLDKRFLGPVGELPPDAWRWMWP